MKAWRPFVLHAHVLNHVVGDAYVGQLPFCIGGVGVIHVAQQDAAAAEVEKARLGHVDRLRAQGQGKPPGTQTLKGAVAERNLAAVLDRHRRLRLMKCALHLVRVSVALHKP
jgi:hypothetical protein